MLVIEISCVTYYLYMCHLCVFSYRWVGWFSLVHTFLCVCENNQHTFRVCVWKYCSAACGKIRYLNVPANRVFYDFGRNMFNAGQEQHKKKTIEIKMGDK